VKAPSRCVPLFVTRRQEKSRGAREESSTEKETKIHHATQRRQELKKRNCFSAFSLRRGVVA
jgi:hypothetical protein